jgi:hypothetical protein
MVLWRRILKAGKDELSIQEAAYDVLRHSDIRMSQISDRTGIPFSTLRTWTVDPDDASGAYRSMPVHAIPPVTNATGNCALLDALESACGRVAFRMPDITNPTQDLVLEIAGTIRKFGDLATSSGQAIHDGGISHAELHQIEDEGYETIQHILRLMSAARAAVSATDSRP